MQNAECGAANRADVLDSVEGDGTTLVELILSTSEEGLELVAALLLVGVGAIVTSSIRMKLL